VNKVIIICGPTASGKTALAVECAKKLSTEVISADSMLIYKHCNIGTAKPDKGEMQGIAHHMIDVAEPYEEFSVGDYKQKAAPIIKRLHSEGKTPIICGGTGFYIKSLLYESHFGSTAKSDAVRRKYEEILSRKGALYLHGLLSEIDAVSAEKLHYNDTKRVIRAIEIYELTGVAKSAQNDEEIPIYEYDAYQYDYNRIDLYNRIDMRVDAMFERGLIEEVKALIDMGISDKNQCMQGIGYKEVYSALKEHLPEEEMKNAVKQHSRNYAKRQVTFFKKFKNLQNLSPDVSLDETAERIIKNL